MESKLSVEDSEHIKWKVDWGQRIKAGQGIIEEEVLSLMVEAGV